MRCYTYQWLTLPPLRLLNQLPAPLPAMLCAIQFKVMTDKLTNALLSFRLWVLKLNLQLHVSLWLPSDIKVNASIRFLCDKYHAGELGSTASVPRAPAKISTEQIKLDHSTLTDYKDKIMLSFNVNEESFPDIDCGHLPQDVVLVIDHSGSMGTDVEAKDGDGNRLENGFSIQDIVNHAAKTVAKTLDNNSRLAIIAFDNNITVIFDLMLMGAMNQSQALTKIGAIRPEGQTNIYGAIEKAVEILDVRTDKTRNSAILMLTDGQPNISPCAWRG